MGAASSVKPVAVAPVDGTQTTSSSSSHLPPRSRLYGPSDDNAPLTDSDPLKHGRIDPREDVEAREAKTMNTRITFSTLKTGHDPTAAAEKTAVIPEASTVLESMSFPPKLDAEELSVGLSAASSAPLMSSAPSHFSLSSLTIVFQDFLGEVPKPKKLNPKSNKNV